MKLLDLPDLIATDLIQCKDLYIFVAEHNKDSAICPQCGAATQKVHDSRWQNIKDIPIRGKEVIIRLEKKRYRCSECGKRGFSEQYESIEPYARKTKRYDKHLVDQAVNRDYSSISRENGLSYTSVKNAVRNCVDPVIEKRIEQNISKLETISIDEFAVVKHHKYAVVISDPVNKEIVDILHSRKKKDLIEYFMSWSDQQRAKVKCFSMDMWGPYKSVAKAVFPDAKRTIKRWKQKIINYFKTGITNGFAEGINNKIKLIKRIGYGVPNIHCQNSGPKKVREQRSSTGFLLCL